MAALLSTHLENQHGILCSWILNRVLTAEEEKLLETHGTYLSQSMDRLFAHTQVAVET